MIEGVGEVNSGRLWLCTSVMIWWCIWFHIKCCTSDSQCQGLLIWEVKRKLFTRLLPVGCEQKAPCTFFFQIIAASQFRGWILCWRSPSVFMLFHCKLKKYTSEFPNRNGTLSEKSAGVSKFLAMTVHTQHSPVSILFHFFIETQITVYNSQLLLYYSWNVIYRTFF